jgi:cyclophilin family peptidyl-prolyl cis-trans isomerase
MGKPLHFKGSTFHRVINDFMCQVITVQVAEISLQETSIRSSLKLVIY